MQICALVILIVCAGFDQQPEVLQLISVFQSGFEPA